ncbi:uncharacterized protein [Rutidosis leptorrhynchoides]|uniref:uncharacterized protein n=1 Tax=Rutidosis leptorrhynchoides TaxID=125765 RepID=UPI003A996A2F
MANLQSKLSQIISNHDQLKISFHHLKSQIKLGLVEAEDVFSSLAVPLMKLVGLKSNEMAEQGRSSTFFMKIGSDDQGECEDMAGVGVCESMSTSDRECNMRRLEEDYTSKAIMAGNELIHKQKLQLVQLVQLLKQVESCVNSSQKSMFHTIDKHKDHIHTFVQKAVTYISVVQQPSHDGHAFNITLKLLKAIYDHVCEVLCSVEAGVDNLVNDLAEQMCKPMIDYVKSFKIEVTAGTCPRLLGALEDMKVVARDGRVELEQARKKVKLAEERKLEALSMMKESEEKIKKMRQYLDHYINDKKESTGPYNRNKLLAPQENQSKDEKLLWELLKKKQTCQQPESPLGPQELVPIRSSTKRQKPTTGKPTIIHRPTTRAYGSLKTRALIPLGSSPSVATTQVLSQKRVAR